MPEKIKLLESTEKMIDKEKRVENVPYLEISENCARFIN